MTRLSPIPTLDDEQTALLVEIVGPDIPPPPPFLMWSHSPGAAAKVEPLGAYCRNDSVLEPRLRILSMLLTGRHFSSGSMWNAHWHDAMDLGLPTDALARLARGEDPAFDDPDLDVFTTFATEVLVRHAPSDATYALACERFGEAGLVDAITLIGNFAMGSLALNTFQVVIAAHLGWPFPDRPRPTWYAAPTDQPAPTTST